MGKRRLVAIDTKKTDVVAIILFFATFVSCALINLFDKRTPVLTTGSVWFDSLIAFGSFVVGLALHEVLHALTGVLLGKIGWKDVSFGLDIKSGNLYTHFRKPMKVGAYKAALILPVMITGVVPLVFATAFGGIILLAPFCILTGGGAGDLMTAFALAKYKGETMIGDHPTALAFYLSYPDGKEPSDFVPTTEEEEKAIGGAETNDEKSKKKTQRRLSGRADIIRLIFR